jgi:hypothetical protein
MNREFLGNFRLLRDSLIIFIIIIFELRSCMKRVEIRITTRLGKRYRVGFSSTPENIEWYCEHLRESGCTMEVIYG